MEKKQAPFIPVIHQWPSGRGCESVFPRCVVFARILNMMNINYKVKSYDLPALGEDYRDKLAEQLWRLPLVFYDEEYYTNSHEIMQLLSILPLHLAGARDVRVKEIFSSHSYIIHEWADEVLLNSLLYSRWLKEENYQRFSQGIMWRNRSDIEERSKILRELVINHIRKRPLASLSEKDFLELLKRQFLSLESLLSEQEFIDSNSSLPTLADLSVFMVIQGYMSPDLEESELIHSQFPQIKRWFESVDHLTKDKVRKIA